MGGSEHLTSAIIQNDKSSNKHIILVMQGNSDYQDYCEKVLNLDFINLQTNSNSFFSVPKWTKLIQVIIKQKPDLIHSYMYDSSLYARILSFFFRIPILIYVVNTYTRKIFRRSLVNFLLSFITDNVIVCSNDVKRDVLRFDRIHPKKIITISSFAIFNFKKEFLPNVRQNLKIKKDDFVLLSIARLVEQKGLIFLFEAVDLLVNIYKLQNIKLVMIGDGPLMNSLSLYICQHNLRKHIFLIGEKNNLNPYLTQSDLYVDSSLHAGLNIASIKAMEAELPIVITDVGGARQLVDEGKFGYLVKASSASSIARGIEWFYNDKKIIDKSRYQFLKSHFSDEVAAKKILMLYFKIFKNA